MLYTAENRPDMEPDRSFEQFLLQGNLVTQNMSSGIIISSESLVLQSVSYQSSGMYRCQAVNERGETASQPVQLRVQCKYYPSLSIST